MILGIGVDSVDISRFNNWYAKSRASLQRIFSDSEISYCLENKAKSAERFAVRFAIREAVFKALTLIDQNHTIPLLTACKAVTVTKKKSGAPEISIAWDIIKPYSTYHAWDKVVWHLSCTHTRLVATAWVIGEGT